MDATLLKIKRYIASKKMACYTLRVNGRERSEFNEFIYKMNGGLTNLEELQDIVLLMDNVIIKWGIEYSYSCGYLIDEKKAHRFVLPFNLWTDENCEYGIRLYCLIVSPKTLIILNGCCKTMQSVQDCPNCLEHFELANKVAEAIEREINLGTIGIDEATGEIDKDDDYQLFIRD